MKFTYNGDGGREIATLVFEHDYDNKYFFQQFCSPADRDGISAEVWLELIQKALLETKKVAASEISFRLTETQKSGLVSQTLPKLGFVRGLDRIEFRSPLSALPTEDGTPFVWQSLEPEGPWTLKEVGVLLRLVSTGDPETDPNDDPIAELEADLSDPVLTNGPDTVHVGWIENRPVSVIVAQLNPKTGWSRITYMGLILNHRGKGLGTWVHRHGFEMLRNQGGTLYHGGTTSQNESMLKLFEKHGCQLYRRMQQWNCKL